MWGSNGFFVGGSCSRDVVVHPSEILELGTGLAQALILFEGFCLGRKGLVQRDAIPQASTSRLQRYDGMMCSWNWRWCNHWYNLLETWWINHIQACHVKNPSQTENTSAVRHTWNSNNVEMHQIFTKRQDVEISYNHSTKETWEIFCFYSLCPPHFCWTTVSTLSFWDSMTMACFRGLRSCQQHKWSLMNYRGGWWRLQS